MPGHRYQLDWYDSRHYGMARSVTTTYNVLINGAPCKPAREVKLGDLIRVTQGPMVKDVRVMGISAMRGSAPVAQALYAETDDSQKAREKAAAARRLAPEPGETIAHGRPTKRDRRAMDEARDWNERWSASLDD